MKSNRQLTDNEVILLRKLVNNKLDQKDILAYVNKEPDNVYDTHKELKVYDISTSTLNIFVHPVGYPNLRSCISPFDSSLNNLRSEL